jgi:Aldo/keto reductase family
MHFLLPSAPGPYPSRPGYGPSPVGQPMGLLSLAWLLHQPGVTSVVAGARNAVQAAENARAADIELDAEVVERLCRATDAVKAHIGANANPWEGFSRMEHRPRG